MSTFRPFDVRISPGGAREEEASARAAPGGKKTKRLDEQPAELRKMNRPPAALTAALAALKDEGKEILKRARGKRGVDALRAQRLILRLDKIAEAYKRLIGGRSSVESLPDIDRPSILVSDSHA